MNRPTKLGQPLQYARGAKIGVYGQFGTGKTELVMSATKVAHLLLLDAEGRSQYYSVDANHGFEVIYSKNIQDAIDLLVYAESLRQTGEQVVFGLDGWSSLWFEQQEVAERIGSTSRGTAKYASWGPAKKPIKQLYAMLYNTTVDCIITMRAKPKYSQAGRKVTAAGFDVPDTERGLGYAVDLVVEMTKQELPPGTPLKPEHFWCTVVKTSGPKEDNPLPIGTTIKDPSFAKLIGLRRAGSETLKIAGGDVELQVLMATITGSKQLGDLIVRFGLETDAVFAHLKEKLGTYQNSKLPAYICEVLALRDATEAQA